MRTYVLTACRRTWLQAADYRASPAQPTESPYVYRGQVMARNALDSHPESGIGSRIASVNRRPAPAASARQSADRRARGQTVGGRPSATWLKRHCAADGVTTSRMPPFRLLQCTPGILLCQGRPFSTGGICWHGLAGDCLLPAGRREPTSRSPPDGPDALCLAHRVPHHRHHC
jgi:hypothetical protein